MMMPFKTAHCYKELNYIQIVCNRGDTAVEEETQAFADTFVNFIPLGENPIEPMSDIFYPVLDKIDKVNPFTENPYNPAQHTAKAIIYGSVYW